MNQHHVPFKWTCDICNKIITHKKSVSRHKNSHKNSMLKFKCLNCSKSFHRKENLERHSKTRVCQSKKKKSSKNTCKVCLKVFSRPWMVVRHMDTHLEKKTFKCSGCGKVVLTERSEQHSLACKLDHPLNVNDLDCQDFVTMVDLSR